MKAIDGREGMKHRDEMDIGHETDKRAGMMAWRGK
jgi:hypothetical protein